MAIWSMFVFIFSAWTGVEVAKWVPTDWLEDLFGAFGAERFAIVAKVIVGLIAFAVGFAIGKYILFFCIIYVVIRMLAKK